MSDTITGSDGIERTIEQWQQFIFERAAFADGDEDNDVLLHAMQGSVQGALDDIDPDTYGDQIELFGTCAGQWMELTLRQAIEGGGTRNKKLTQLADSIEKLSRAVGKFGYKKAQRAKLGWELFDYVKQHSDLPRDRKDLYRFIKENGKCSIPNRTVDEYLSWYAIEDICRGNQRG